MAANAPLRLPAACTSKLIVPLVPFGWSSKAWLALPSLSRWLINTVRLGYMILFTRHLPRFNDILFTSVVDKDTPVLCVETGKGRNRACPSSQDE